MSHMILRFLDCDFDCMIVILACFIGMILKGQLVELPYKNASDEPRMRYFTFERMNKTNTSTDPNTMFDILDRLPTK